MREMPRRTKASIAGAGAVLAVALGLGSGAASGAGGATASTTTTFHSTGGEQIFEVPNGVTSLDVFAVGGKGGSGASPTPGLGGFGAAAAAKLAVTPGQTLFIEVAGNGGAGATALSGFNGGGSGSDAFFGEGGGGGGASDIRTISRAAVPIGYIGSLTSRLIIAGGGGGGGGGSGSDFGGAGGSAGGLGSGNGSHGGDGGDEGGDGGQGIGAQGATRTAGGLSVFDAGELGTGGNGGPTDAGGPLGSLFGGGGGGGGTFGGGGGGSGGDGGGGGGGGGSTSFAPTASDTFFATDNTGMPLIRLTYAAGGSKSGLKFGKVKLNKKKGTATLPVTVPGSGNLTLGGKGVVKKRPGMLGRWLARKIDAAGTYKLKVKAKGRKKAKLFDTGKVTVKAVVSFKPTSGDKVSDSKRIRLKKN
jgi:hypothetical protein